MHNIILEDVKYITSRHFKQVRLLKDKNILITGSTGMIMSYMAEFLVHLNQEYSLNMKIYLHGRTMDKLLLRHKNISGNRNVILVDFDILNPLDTDIEYDYIVHAASPAGTKSFLEKPVETILPNVYGMKNILEYAVGKKTKVCFLSSNAIYGNVTKDINGCANTLISEDDYGIVDPLEERACYIEAKKLSEQLCMAYHREYAVKSTIARIPFTYGPTYDLEHDTRAIPRFIKNIIENKNIEIFADETLLQYTYAADVVSAIIFLLTENKAIGQAFNICTEKSMGMGKIIKKMLDNNAEKSSSQLIVKKQEDEYYFSQNKNINLSILDNSKLKGLGWYECYDFDLGIKQSMLGIYQSRQ